MSDKDDHAVYVAKTQLTNAILGSSATDFHNSQVITEKVDDLINARLVQGVNLFNEKIEALVSNRRVAGEVRKGGERNISEPTPLGGYDNQTHTGDDAYPMTEMGWKQGVGFYTKTGNGPVTSMKEDSDESAMHMDQHFDPPPQPFIADGKRVVKL